MIKKESSKRDQYTGVLEDIRDQNRAFGEGLTFIREKVKSTDGKVDSIDKKLGRVETDLELIKGELAIIRHNQVTRDEFKFLEARVVRLEKQRR